MKIEITTVSRQQLKGRYSLNLGGFIFDVLLAQSSIAVSTANLRGCASVQKALYRTDIKHTIRGSEDSHFFLNRADQLP